MKEVAQYDDFILLDIKEEYSKLPYKTLVPLPLFSSFLTCLHIPPYLPFTIHISLAFFKAAYALYDSEFYVKADDDIYLRPGQSFHYYILFTLLFFFFVHCVNPIIYPCLPLFLDRLSLLLAKERSHTQTYLGCMKKGPVFTDPKLKWLASHFCLYLPILRIYILHLALPFPISFLPPRRSRSMIPALGSGVIQTESI